MKYFALLTALCGAAFAQSAPDSQNAASEMLKKRIASMDLLKPPKLASLKTLPAPASSVCSIPLLNVRPAGNYKTPIVKPPAQVSARELQLKVPAPACGEGVFQNK